MVTIRYIDRLVANDILALGNLQVEGNLQAGNIDGNINVNVGNVFGNINDTYGNIYITNMYGNVTDSNVIINSYNGDLSGANVINAAFTGTITGNVNASNATITGPVSGNINSSNVSIGAYTGNLDQANIGAITGNVSIGTYNGNLDLDTFSGNITNSNVFITNFDGNINGDVSNIDIETNYGDLDGNVVNVANVNGDIGADTLVAGNVSTTGNITIGNVQGGSLTGNIDWVETINANVVGNIVNANVVNNYGNLDGNVSVDSLQFINPIASNVDVSNLASGATTSFNVTGTTNAVITLSGPPLASVMLSMDSILVGQAGTEPHDRDVITSVSRIQFGSGGTPATIDVARIDGTSTANLEADAGATATSINLIYSLSDTPGTIYGVLSHVSITPMY